MLMITYSCWRTSVSFMCLMQAAFIQTPKTGQPADKYNKHYPTLHLDIEEEAKAQKEQETSKYQEGTRLCHLCLQILQRDHLALSRVGGCPGVIPKGCQPCDICKMPVKPAARDKTCQTVYIMRLKSSRTKV